MFVARHAVWMVAAGVLSGVSGTALAQAWPAKPIRIVTTAPGSGTDLVARLIAQGFAASWGQQGVVDNRGIVAIEIAQKAPPDGYTLLLYTSPLWLTPVFRNDVAWDPIRDFLPITAPTRTPNVLVVHPSLPVISVKGLIALAKSKPGELNYASGSTGASAHIAAELFKTMAGVDFLRVNFKGTGPAMTALLSGEVQVMFPAAGSVTMHVKAGKLRALAVTTDRPTPLVPGLPTVSESGLPGYESTSIAGLFAPAGTPAAVIRRLNAEIVRILNTPEVKDKLFVTGVGVLANSSEDFAGLIKSEMTRMGKLIKGAGFGR